MKELDAKERTKKGLDKQELDKLFCVIFRFTVNDFLSYLDFSTVTLKGFN